MICLRHEDVAVGELIIECADYESFTREWHANALDDARGHGSLDERDIRYLWVLLDLLDEDRVVIHIPDWLSEKKLDVSARDNFNIFVGPVSRETEDALFFENAEAARPLMQFAHRIRSLENGIENTKVGDDRRASLETQLRDKRRNFENRDGGLGLTRTWIPKSQIISAVQRRG